MYITINNVISEKTIDLSYPILSGKEVVVITMLSNNIQYSLKDPMKVPLLTSETIVLKGVYMDKELDALIGMELISKFISHDDVLKKNKLENVMEMAISLNELDYTDNLEDGRLSSELVTYHVTADEDFTCFEPKIPQYKKLKNREFISPTLRIKDQNNNIITDGPQVTVVLHICDCKI